MISALLEKLYGNIIFQAAIPIIFLIFAIVVIIVTDREEDNEKKD